MIGGLSLLALTLAYSPLATQAGPGTAAKQNQSAHAVKQKETFEQVSKAANAAREADHDDDAIPLYQEALRLRPEWPEGMWYLSTLLYQKERFAESRDLLRQFVALEPKAGPAWALLGMSEYQTREYSRALDHLKRAMREGWQERKELSQSVFYFASVLLTRFEQYDDSMGLLFSTVKTTPQTDLFVEPLGLAALQLPLLPTEIPPDRRELVQMAGKGSLAIENRQNGDPEQIFSGMVVAYPNEPGVHFLYGAYLLNVRPEDGIREMQRELQISPSHVGAMLRLAEEYVKEQKFEEALKFAEQATKLAPKNAAAHMMWGESLLAKGETAKGITELEQAEKLAPETVRTHWDLLRAYTNVGRAADAKREKETIEEISRPETKPVERDR